MAMLASKCDAIVAYRALAAAVSLSDGHTGTGRRRRRRMRKRRDGKLLLLPPHPCCMLLVRSGAKSIFSASLVVWGIARQSSGRRRGQGGAITLIPGRPPCQARAGHVTAFRPAPVPATPVPGLPVTHEVLPGVGRLMRQYHIAMALASPLLCHTTIVLAIGWLAADFASSGIHGCKSVLHSTLLLICVCVYCVLPSLNVANQSITKL